jgi:hypothetical protein
VEDTDATLWALEKEFWVGGADVYRRRLADDAVMVFPGMLLTKSQTVDSVAAGSRWTAVDFSDQRVVRLTTDAAALIYRAAASRPSATSAYSALISSVYVRRGGEWTLVLHQQSPADSSQ